LKCGSMSLKTVSLTLNRDYYSLKQRTSR